MTDLSLPLEGAPRKIKVEEAARMARWSSRTVYRHMPYFRTYLLTQPEKTRGRRIIDYADFCRYLEQRAQGPINEEPA